MRFVEGTELAAPEDTTREDILEEAGYKQTYDVDEIIARMPTLDETTRLYYIQAAAHPSLSTDTSVTPPKTSPAAS